MSQATSELLKSRLEINLFETRLSTKRTELESVSDLDSLIELSSSLFTYIFVNRLKSLLIELLTNVFANILANNILDFFVVLLS